MLLWRCNNDRKKTRDEGNYCWIMITLGKIRERYRDEGNVGDEGNAV